MDEVYFNSILVYTYKFAVVVTTEASVLVTVVFKIIDSAVYTGCKITSITN